MGMTGTVTVSSGTVTTTAPISSTTTSSRGPCMAEVIYGGQSEEMKLLRYFRDHVLNTTPEGQELIRLYYFWSPALVNIMQSDEEFKSWVQDRIDEVLPLIEETVE